MFTQHLPLSATSHAFTSRFAAHIPLQKTPQQISVNGLVVVNELATATPLTGFCNNFA